MHVKLEMHSYITYTNAVTVSLCIEIFLVHIWFMSAFLFLSYPQIPLSRNDQRFKTRPKDWPDLQGKVKNTLIGSDRIALMTLAFKDATQGHIFCCVGLLYVMDHRNILLCWLHQDSSRSSLLDNWWCVFGEHPAKPPPLTVPKDQS